MKFLSRLKLLYIYEAYIYTEKYVYLSSNHRVITYWQLRYYCKQNRCVTVMINQGHSEEMRQ